MSLRFLDALLPRLKDSHPKIANLKTKAAMIQKGYNGERKLDYHLNLLSNEFSVLNDISLKYQHTTFQIDSLIISNHAIFIIDSKSIEGEITFDTQLQQLIQTHHQKVTSFKYPITQLESIKFSLMQWLKIRNIHGLPIFYFVSLAESSSILKVVGDENHIRKTVTFAENIPHCIMQKNNKLEGCYEPNNHLKDKIISAIMNEHVDLYIDIKKRFNITQTDILPGVVCEKCYKLKTSYNFGYWTCTNCGYKDNKGYVRGFHDYFLLFGNGISNKDAREFLMVPYKSTMTRMLQRSNLIYKKEYRKWYHK